MPTIKRVPITDIVVPDIFVNRCQPVTEEERLAFEPIINRDPLPVVVAARLIILSDPILSALPDPQSLTLSYGDGSH